MDLREIAKAKKDQVSVVTKLGPNNFTGMIISHDTSTCDIKTLDGYYLRNIRISQVKLAK